MVGIGMAMIFTGILAVILFLRKKLFESRLFHIWCVALTPAGFIALLAGWFVTEIGRQPYTAYGVIRTAESVSPVLGAHVAYPCWLIVVYAIIFGAAAYYITKLIQRGIDTGKEGFEEHSKLATPLKILKKGHSNV